MTNTHGYAPVNGLQMYYEVHGSGGPGSLVLVHGALSATGTSFGALLPELAKTRQVISVELQAHGHTADIDRPLTIPQLADDVAALVGHLGLANADFFGYSVGAAVVFDLAVRHPEVVRRQVLASIAYNATGIHPGTLDGIDELKPEDMMGSPFYEEYARIAPRPQDWPTLVEKVKQLDRTMTEWSAEAVRSVRMPTMLVYGDSDIVRPEHAAEMFRLLGGGVFGDVAGLPQARLAIVPGTTHASLAHRGTWIAPMIEEFLG
jgi:pimeloyl-ACP methyl ester carboxylesterase